MKTSLIILLVACTLFVSCNKTSVNPDFEGTWIDQQNRELTFNGTSFTYRNTSGQNPEFQYSLSRGVFLITGNRINFSVTQNEWLDRIFYPDMKKPQVENVKTTIMEDCTYQFQREELVLNFTTYPADAPVLTKAIFKRK